MLPSAPNNPGDPELPGSPSQRSADGWKKHTSYFFGDAPDNTGSPHTQDNTEMVMEVHEERPRPHRQFTQYFHSIASVGWLQSFFSRAQQLQQRHRAQRDRALREMVNHRFDAGLDMKEMYGRSPRRSGLRTLRSLRSGTSVFGKAQHWSERLVTHRYFTYAVAAVVVTSAGVIFIEEEYLANLRLEGKRCDSPCDWFLAVDWLLAIVFCAEVSLRLSSLRLAFVVDVWNLVDVFLVVSALLDCFLATFIHPYDNQKEWRVLRVFRFGRLVYLLHIFQSLWIFVIGVLSALRTLVWAGVLLFGIIYVFSLFATRLFRGLGEQNEELELYFGSVGDSMVTLLFMMTMEGWADVVRLLAEETTAWVLVFAFYFLFFSMTTWGLMNLVMAVIIEATVGKANHYMKNYVRVQSAKRQETIVKLTNAFYSMTGHEHGKSFDRNATMDRETFAESLKDENMVRVLHEVGIDVRQARTLFDLLDVNGSSTVTVYEFTAGVLEARGKAHAMDVLRLKYDLKRLTNSSERAVQHVTDDCLQATQSLAEEAAKLRRTLQAFETTDRYEMRLRDRSRTCPVDVN